MKHETNWRTSLNIILKHGRLNDLPELSSVYGCMSSVFKLVLGAAGVYHGENKSNIYQIHQYRGY